MTDPPDRNALDGIRRGRLPEWLERSAAIGWRILVLVAVVVVVALGLVRLRVVVLPLILALMLAAVLSPAASWLRERGWPPLAATWSVLLAALAAVSALVWALVPPLVGGLAGVGDALASAYDDVKRWLMEDPLSLSAGSIADFEAAVGERVRHFAQTGLAGRATFVVELVAGLFLTLVTTFFYVKDGDRFRERVVEWMPEDDQPRTREAMAQGWTTLQRYLVGVLVVGAADAALIGLGLVVIGVPHVVPVMVLTFVAAFFPLVGAIFAGAVAALLALAAGGAVDALLVVLLTLVVQQIDGDVIAPLVYSRAVRLHPLAVLIALTAGGVVAGIVGAFLAVPVLAVGLAVRRAWAAPG